MWIRCNPNPGNKEVPDCVIRAICIALRKRWVEVYDDLAALGRVEFNMPSADAVWGKYLYQKGFEPFLLPNSCPRCITVNQFCQLFPYGKYIIGTGSHAVTVIDGNYFDTYDSGGMIPSYYWRIA